MLDWYRIQPAIARITEVCSYDRARREFIDAAPASGSGLADAVDDLHALLHAAAIAPPYVLVGHSLAQAYSAINRAAAVTVNKHERHETNRFVDVPQRRCGIRAGRGTIPSDPEPGCHPPHRRYHLGQLTTHALVSLALLLLPARSADRKKSLQFGRRGGVESGLLNEPRLSSLLLGFASRLEGCSLGSFRGRSFCGFARYRLASDPLSFRDPDVAGCDDLRSSLYSPQPGGVIRNCPGAFNLSLLRSAGST
jgi:hypothetical protein